MENGWVVNYHIWEMKLSIWDHGIFQFILIWLTSLLIVEMLGIKNWRLFLRQVKLLVLNGTRGYKI
jgi:hypothetical protein